MRNFLLLILSISFFCSRANQTTLLGNIRGIDGGTYINSPVEVLIVTDFITYKKERPWGCKKFGFISKFIPSSEVFSTTGIECAYRRENNS